MASEKSQAIIIRLVEFSESSCVVTMFTRDFGKIGALAKGARRPKSPFESALDLLALCRIVFLHKSSDALDLLTEAKLERRFRAATGSLPHLYAGYYVAELINELTHTGDPHPELFDVANQTIHALDAMASPLRTISNFEIKALQLLGHFPSLRSCSSCGVDIEKAKRVPFGQLSGGVLCPGCRVGRTKVIGISSDVLETMITLSETATADVNDVISPRVLGELRGLLNNYIAHLLGKRPRLHKFMSQMATADAAKA
ncbi:MAG: DNA repair protein RecO [Rhodopirellula sp.]|jgi:DNA repair protein RecO (recombination protein O)|nr:DNA repair protein RecO [Rhodopirellula sp.]HCP84190.1 DNA repair protein RecO [Planctomycetaceae bacterium]|tara:strand:+ start:53 stop:823 length:771 start_codon:yes stop_codon:yes gene_type:complete